MQVKVRFFALYRELAGTKEVQIEIAKGTTVALLQRKVAREFPALRDRLENAIVAVNARYSPLDRSLKEGDEVAFLPPFAGGSS